MNLLTKKNNFLFFAMLVFIFVASTALSISGQIPKVEALVKSKISESKNFPPLPVLGINSSFPILSAQGVIAIDLNSGITLYEKNADAQLLPASTTKIVTALVALDFYQLDEVLTVGKGVHVDGQKMGLFTGEKIKFEDLLYGLLVYSANDAAETLAQDYPGGYDAFINAMNTKAQDLSMTNSHFDNPVGLDGDGQRSTAKDLVRVSEVAMRNSEFAKVVGTKNITVHDDSTKFSYNLRNVNELLGSVPGVMGVKTGWTENARENLVTYIERDNHKIMIAILGSQDRFGETKELIDWIFTNYKWQEVKFP
ncbi:MAG TPA: D-alanyl-D-alanine carboxypeptidase family protein [Patescibacteria group bacterium]|nr:D-alanyl-D-alanine carboxypeptidase family protein [Patescibacteria group bacterium]